MTLSPFRRAADSTPSGAKRQKYFVNRKETVTIKCRICGQDATFIVADLQKKHHYRRVNCACGQSFEIDLEFRQNHRQQANIAASFRALTTPKTRARQCVIADHSNGGLLLAITEEVPIGLDDRLIVCYRPTPDSPEVEQIVRVRHYSQGRRIGGAFVDTDPGSLPHSYRHATALH